MKNLQIPVVHPMGQVLTLDEMKSIIGGDTINVTCTCSLYFKGIDDNGYDYSDTTTASPNGTFLNMSDCQKACDDTCHEYVDCQSANANYHVIPSTTTEAPPTNIAG